MSDRPQKITFGEMREMGVRGVLVYSADCKCCQAVAMSAVDDVTARHLTH
jgi:hypothetical protein